MPRRTHGPHVCPRCRRPGHTSRECCSKLLQTVLPLDGPADMFTVEGLYTNDARTAQERRPLLVALPAVWVNYDVTATVLGFLSWRDVLASVGHVNLEMKGCIAPLAEAFVSSVPRPLDAPADAPPLPPVVFERGNFALRFAGGLLAPLSPMTVLRLELERKLTVRKDDWHNCDDGRRGNGDGLSEVTSGGGPRPKYEGPFFSVTRGLQWYPQLKRDGEVVMGGDYGGNFYQHPATMMGGAVLLVTRAPGVPRDLSLVRNQQSWVAVFDELNPPRPLRLWAAQFNVLTVSSQVSS